MGNVDSSSYYIARMNGRKGNDGKTIAMIGLVNTMKVMKNPRPVIRSTRTTLDRPYGRKSRQ